MHLCLRYTVEDRAASKRSYDRDDYYVTKGTARSPRGAGSKDPAPPKTEDEDAHARTYTGGGGWMDGGRESEGKGLTEWVGGWMWVEGYGAWAEGWGVTMCMDLELRHEV